MNVLRSSTLISFFIILPLLIWVTGELTENQSHAKVQYIVQQAIQIFYCLHLFSTCISIPIFCRYISFSETIFTSLISLLIPLPLLILSWLMGSIPWFSIIKYGILFIIISSICLFIILIINKFRILAYLSEGTSLFFCLLIAAFLLDNYLLWLNWLVN